MGLASTVNVLRKVDEIGNDRSKVSLSCDQSCKMHEPETPGGNSIRPVTEKKLSPTIKCEQLAEIETTIAIAMIFIRMDISKGDTARPCRNAPAVGPLVELEPLEDLLEAHPPPRL